MKKVLDILKIFLKNIASDVLEFGKILLDSILVFLIIIIPFLGLASIIFLIFPQINYYDSVMYALGIVIIYFFVIWLIKKIKKAKEKYDFDIK